jgi:glycosyltransferase involved in cell wall biosynthesis
MTFTNESKPPLHTAMQSKSHQPPRLAYLTSYYGRATDTFVRSEVAALRRRGFSIRTYSIRRPAASDTFSHDVQREQDRTHYILEQGWPRLLRDALHQILTRPRRFLKTLRLAWQTAGPGATAALKQLAYFIEATHLARHLQRLRIEHMHNHIPANAATVCMLAAELSDIPFSLTIHGPTTFYHPTRWALTAKLERAAFTACITHFCRSQCMLFCAPEHWPRLHVVRCGVSAAFRDQSETPPPAAPRLVFVGRLCAEKGLPVLLDAADQLRARQVSFELLILGDGPMREPIEADLTARGLSSHVRVLGNQTSEQVRAHLLDSRALVLPSFAEGLPVVLMEAMALQRPVVTTWVAGIAELVDNGQTGWLVPPGDAAALADAMHSALTCSPDTLHAMGRRGAEAVARYHDIDTEAGKLDALFRSVSERDAAAVEPQTPGNHREAKLCR